MTDSIHIRKAVLEDITMLLEFEQGVIEAERPFDVTLKREATRYYDIEEMIHAPHIELVVAEWKGKVVGCGYARIERAKPFLQHTQHGYLGFMYVKHTHRGMGINSAIMKTLAGWSARNGVTELRLEVYSANEPAIKAYEKIGFTKHMIEMRMRARQVHPHQ